MGWTECYVQTDKTDSRVVLKLACQTRNPKNKKTKQKKEQKQGEMDNADLWAAKVSALWCALASPSQHRDFL